MTRNGRRLRPYVPRLALGWGAAGPGPEVREVDGTLALADISGFTALTERLARRGREGAEQVSDLLSDTFSRLLDIADADGADLVKWGGDAMLLLFRGEGHERRAARSSVRMLDWLSQAAPRVGGRRVGLGMSVGLHSDRFQVALIGEPSLHRELVIAGPGATRVVQAAGCAESGQVVVTPECARHLGDGALGGRVPGGWLLAAEPEVAEGEAAAAPPPPSAGDGDVALLLPPDVRAHLLEAGGGSEHRRVTVAFVRLSGTDRLVEEGGADALASALHASFQVVQEACARAGVTLLATDVDADGMKVLVVAGTPVSVGGHDERMLRAALDIVRVPTPLHVRVGVSRGPVFAGDFGPERRRTFTVIGDAVNLAARLLGVAGPAEAVATAGVIEHASSAVVSDELEPVRVKGKSEPVRARRVLSLGGEGAVRADPSLFGRGAELDLLRNEREASISGRARTVVITGPPGIGRSRLVAELQREGEALLVRGDPYESATPYWPLRDLLRAVLGLGAGPPDPESITSAMERRERGLGRWAPLVASALDVDMDPTPETEALDDEFRRDRLEQTVVRLLRVALSPGSVLAVDDAHLLDDSTSSLVEALQRDSRGRRWLLLVSRRDDRAEPDDELAAESAVVLRLGPLAPPDARSLLREQLVHRPLRPHDEDHLLDRAAGNPRFLLGLARAVLDGESATALPETVEALVTAQIDALPSGERRLLRTASVLGLAFAEADLDSLLHQSQLPVPEPSGERLGRFLRREDGGRLRFDSSLVRDTAYEGLPYRQRRELHGRAAEVLAQGVSDPLDVAEVLSLHYVEAGRMPEAWHFARAAGDRATAKSAYAQAEVLYERALRAARSLRGLPAEERATVQVALGDARRRLGEGEKANAAFRAARSLLGGDDPVLVAGIQAREANVHRRLGRYSVALRVINQALALLGDARDGATLAAASELAMIASGIMTQQGRYREALAWARRAEADATDAGDVEVRADAAAMMHGSLLMMGTPDRRYGESALRWYQQSGHRLHQSEALNNLAMLSWSEGRGREALDEFRQAHQLALESGDSYQAAATASNIGDVLLRLGRPEEAIEVLRETLPTLRALGAGTFESVCLRSIGLASAMLGDLGAAGTLLVEAREQQVARGERDEVLETDASLAWLRLLEGDPATAMEMARDAAERTGPLEAEHLLPFILRIQGAALVELGRPRDARPLLEHALEVATQQALWAAGFIHAELARVAAALGEHEDAVDHRRLAVIEWGLLGFEGNERYPLRVFP